MGHRVCTTEWNQIAGRAAERITPKPEGGNQGMRIVAAKPSGLANAEHFNIPRPSRTQHGPQLSFLDLMPKNLLAVEVQDGDVILVGLEPLRLLGFGDVDQF